MQKKKSQGGLRVGGEGGPVRGGGGRLQSGNTGVCVQRIEVIVKTQKKKLGGGSCWGWREEGVGW